MTENKEITSGKMQLFDISAKNYYVMDALFMNNNWVQLDDNRYKICVMSINQRIGWLIVNAQQYKAIQKKGNCDKHWLLKFIHIQRLFWGNYMCLVVDDLNNIVKHPKVLENHQDLLSLMQYANDVLNQRKAAEIINNSGGVVCM